MIFFSFALVGKYYNNLCSLSQEVIPKERIPGAIAIAGEKAFLERDQEMLGSILVCLRARALFKDTGFLQTLLACAKHLLYNKINFRNLKHFVGTCSFSNWMGFCKYIMTS